MSASTVGASLQNEAGLRELEAARVASDERTRLALHEAKRIDDVLPGREETALPRPHLGDGGLRVRVRINDPKYRLVGMEASGSGKCR